MASSSSSFRQQNEEDHALSSIEPSGKRKRVDESTRLYDVFINYKGEDVNQTLAIELYNSLEQLDISAFHFETLDLGESISSTIETAIRSAAVHIAIFSKRYAESRWCLAELVLMLQSQAKIIPVFYDVEPEDVRNPEKGVYAKAFSYHRKRGRYLEEKLKEWKEALQTVSLMSGIIFNNLQDLRKSLLPVVLDEVRRKKPLFVARYPVGLDKFVQDFERRCLDKLVHDCESQCWMSEEVKEKGNIVGIYGMGGMGKTTLSKELFNRKRSEYSRACFLFDVREASVRNELPSLQRKLLQDIFDLYSPHFQSIKEGTSYIRDCVKERNSLFKFLLVIDDIDNVEQLDALVCIDILNKFVNSLVIVTTRNVDVLGREVTIRYNLKEFETDEARELFCWHAFGQRDPPSRYEDLVDGFLDVCEGLPLSLQVLGAHVHGHTEDYWLQELSKVSNTSHGDIQKRHEISFDALDEEEKQVFMDIACFFIDKPKSMALIIWEGCGWNSEHALLNLKNRCLVQIYMNDWTGYEFDDKLVLKMHDDLRALGRKMADELSFPRRCWNHRLLESKGMQNILTETSGRSFRYLRSFFDLAMASQFTYFLGNRNNDETPRALLWLEVELEGYEEESMPPWIPLQDLQGLRLFSPSLKHLWENNAQAPVQLKELVLHECSLVECTNSIRILKQLEKLVIIGRNEGMLIDGSALSECLRGLTNLRSLVLSYFALSGDLALSSYGESTTPDCGMKNLQTIEIRVVGLVSMVSISGDCCPALQSLCLESMENLIEVDLTLIKTLNSFELRLCKNLRRISGNFDLVKLKILNILKCSELEELPNLACLSSVERITIDGCMKLQKITGIEQLRGLKYFHVLAGDGAIRNCIKMLQPKEMPLEVTSVIGKANRTAKATFDTKQFSDLIGAETDRDIDINETGILMVEESVNMATIICVVVRGSYVSATNAIKIPLPSGSWIESSVGGGQWIVTIVITGQKNVNYKEIIPSVGGGTEISKLWILRIKRGQQQKPLHVLKKIIAQLYEKPKV